MFTGKSGAASERALIDSGKAKATLSGHYSATAGRTIR